MKHTNIFTVTTLITIWLFLSVAMVFWGFYYTISGNPEVAGSLYISSLIHIPVSAIALGFALRKKRLQ